MTMCTIVAEDDPIIRAAQVILDPTTTPERYSAIADYYSVDVPDFDQWVNKLRTSYKNIFPSKITMVAELAQYHLELPFADGIICQNLPVGKNELELAPNLKVVQKFGIYTRNIDINKCKKFGVLVLPLRRRVNIAVAEHAFTMMLAMSKQLCQINHLIDEDSLKSAGFKPKMFDLRHTASANWARIQGLTSINGSTVGCLGLGEIGREVAFRAQAFGANILYYQRNRVSRKIENSLGATYVSFEKLLTESDYISIHLPLHNSTTNMINAKAFRLLKEGAFLVNISRADIINRKALLDALKSDRLGGIAMDVHYDEPAAPGEPLKDFSKAILTPHVGVGGRGNGAADMEEIISNLARKMPK